MADHAKDAADDISQEIQVNVHSEDKLEDASFSWLRMLVYIVGVLSFLFIFLVGLSLMGNAFKVLGGRGASSMFEAVDNPVSGLMTGVLATVLVQSSSTSTSIVVAMVGEGALTVRHAIPVIMGANIGTSVTNTIVSLGQAGDPVHLQRAFSGATVHDMFNMLSVATLLPLEAMVAAIQGEGGPLYWLTHGITELLMGGEGGDPLFTSPLKLATSPIVNHILKSNKYVIYALTLEKPMPLTPTKVDEDLCQPLTLRRLSSSDVGSRVSPGNRSLLSRRLSDKQDCSRYYCVGKDLDKQFKKISSSSYEKLTQCGSLIQDAEGEPCGGDRCYLDAGLYYEEKVEKGELIKGGFLKAAGDSWGGILGLALSILLLCVGLVGLCKLLERMFMKSAKQVLRYATKLNDYVAILIGLGITIVVQSSSVTTSALTPLCGVGILPLEKMLPLTLGANIGTTVTSMMASLVSLKFGAVQIALCHLCFNLAGIILWFPVPAMRQVPLGAARLLGLYAAYFRFVPVAYLLFAFVLVPGVCLGIVAMYAQSVWAGSALLLALVVVVVVFEVAWIVGIPRGNALCYKVLPKEARDRNLHEPEQDTGCVVDKVLEPECPEQSSSAPISPSLPV